MGRTERLREVRKMRFEEACGGWRDAGRPEPYGGR